MLNESKTLVMLVRYRTVEIQQGTKYHATQRLGRGEGSYISSLSLRAVHCKGAR